MTYLLGTASTSAMWSSLLFGLVLFAVAAFLFVTNRRTWKQRMVDDLDERSLDFFHRQYRRRRQVNVLLGVVAIAILLGVWVQPPFLSILFWLGVVGLVVWIGLLATLDFISTYSFFQDVGADQRATREALSAEIDRLRTMSARESTNGNGRHRPD